MLNKEKIDNTPNLILGKLRGDKVIWIILVLLTVISLLIIYSSSSPLAHTRHTTNFNILIGHIKYFFIGYIALYVCYRIPIKWYRYSAAFALLINIVLLVMTIFFGSNINGAVRGLNIGGITFQPSELAKITVVLYMARIIEISKLESFWEYFLKVAVPIGIVILLVAYGSISMALVISIIFFLILYITRIKWSYIFKTILIAVAAIFLVVVAHLIYPKFLPRLDTATGRIERFFKDDSRNEDSANLSKEELQKLADENLQEDMAKLAVQTGGFFGKGPGKSTLRFFLPHPYSDFVYSTIIEEYGLLLGFLVVILYIALLFRCIRLAKLCNTLFSAVTVGGIGFAITLQAFLHIMVNVGILPITGHTLPLISLGGSSLVIILSSFGVILSVSRTKEIALARAKDKEAKERQKKIEENYDYDEIDMEQKDSDSEATDNSYEDGESDGIDGKGVLSEIGEKIKHERKHQTNQE